MSLAPKSLYPATCQNFLSYNYHFIKVRFIYITKFPNFKAPPCHISHKYINLLWYFFLNLSNLSFFFLFLLFFFLVSWTNFAINQKNSSIPTFVTKLSIIRALSYFLKIILMVTIIRGKYSRYGLLIGLACDDVGGIQQP